MTRGGSHGRFSPMKSCLWFGTYLNVVFPKHKGLIEWMKKIYDA